MPLSDHEQKLLDEIEQALYAEDPKFATHVRTARARSRSRRDGLWCILGGLVGLGLVLIGLIVPVVAVSVVGFVIMVASCGWGAQLILHRARAAAGPARPAAGRPRAPRSAGFRTRMEERLRRRFDQE